MITYEPLWNTLKEKGISQYSLIKDYNISRGQLSRMKANQNISTHILNCLCSILDCELNDIARFVKDENDDQQID